VVKVHPTLEHWMEVKEKRANLARFVLKQS
jgi:hypothetical protein